MKKLALILLCSTSLWAYAQSPNQENTKTAQDDTKTQAEIAEKRQLLLGSWQCQSSPQMTQDYHAQVSATYQFLPDGILNVAKTSKVTQKPKDVTYQIDTKKRWQLYQENNLTLIAEQNVELTRFDSQNADKEEIQNLKDYIQDADRIDYMIVTKLDKTHFNFGYTNGIVTEFDVFRCQRTTK